MRKDLYQELYHIENNHWWHQHKRKLVHQLIEKYSSKPGKVLDVGAGTGKLLYELKIKGWQIDGIDGDYEAIKYCKQRRVKISQHDVKKRLPFKTNSFELVTALDVLEHVKDDKKLLVELKRVVKSKGMIIITVPAYQWLFSYWDKMLKHFRRYTKGDLVKLGKQSRLKLKLISYYSSFFLVPAIMVRLLKSKKANQAKSDFQTTPLPLVSIPILGILAMIERLLLKIIRLPLGMSLVCVFQKN